MTRPDMAASGILARLQGIDLRTRMVGVLVLVVVGCGALGYGYWQSLQELRLADARRAKIDATATAINEFRLGLVAQRRHETEFLLRRSARDVEQHRAAAERSRAGLEKFLNGATDASGKAVASDLSRNFATYLDGFKELVAARERVGVNEKSGALGRLRDAVHNVEATLKKEEDLRLGYIMLMMRRHEKDFLARSKPKYVAKMAARMKEFDAGLRNSPINTELKQQIRVDMETYQKEFASVVAATAKLQSAEQVAEQAAGALESDLDTAAAWTERTLSAEQEWQEARHAAANRTFTVELVGFAVLLTAMLVLMARGIIVRLGADPAILAGAVERISAGELERAPGVPEGKTIGVMGAIEDMRRRLAQVVGCDVRRIVDAARDGDLGQRIDVTQSEGFYADLGTGVNDLVEASGAVVADSSRVFAGMARGDLSVRIERDYQGDFAKLRDDANATVERLQSMIGTDVRGLVEAAGVGDFSRRIDDTGYAGFFGELAAQLNGLMETSERGLGDVVRVLQALARGNLSERIEADYQGLFGQLKQDSNATVDKLREVVGSIGQSAAEVSRGSAEISQGNASLSSRTEEQASNLEETAAAMEEMTSTVKQNADNARQANQLADGARGQAEHGGEVATQAVAAMGEISASSRKISDIIGVIDEIAFQTNLLALNASVEAARAGEQGRGFAVVASEVRNLAGRSATAAKEIKELIEDSAGKVDEGSRLVDESGRALEEILGSVKKVTDIVAEIAAASREQSEGIDQINRAVTQIDEMTQQNAALVEEAASASESMGAQARALDEMVSFFDTGAAAAGGGSALTERRASTRPWSEPAKAPAAPAKPAATPAPAKAAAGGDEWEEF